MSDDTNPHKAYATEETPPELAAKLLEGLDRIINGDDTVEKWLVEEVVPVAVAMQTNPERAVSAETAFTKIRALHAERMEGNNGDAAHMASNNPKDA